MSFREISRVLAIYFLLLAAALCVPLVVSVYYEHIAIPEISPLPQQLKSTGAFVRTILICLLLSGVLKIIGRKSRGYVYRREALILVCLIWFFTTVVGGLPFLFSGILKNPIDACFETMSGLTTTGSSILEGKKFDAATGQEIPIEVIINERKEIKYSYYGTISPIVDPETGKVLLTGVEAVSKGLLFWRSFTQWLGGVGIVVLFIAILPILGVGGRMLFQAEVAGPIKEGITPRIAETAKALWKIYLLLTVLEIASLMVTNEKMGFFDAATITFSTLATGGFSVHNESIGYYRNAATEWVIIVFMILGAINFTHYYHILRGKIYRIFEAELFLFLSLIIVFGGISFYYLYGNSIVLLTGEIIPADASTALRYGLFQIISAQTSTGFATADFDLWPFTVQGLIITCMFIGGMAGSTAGGIKVVRHLIVFKIVTRTVEMLFRPEAVRQLRIGSGIIDHRLQITTFSFISVLLFTALFGILVYIADGIDPYSAISITGCNLNNIGFALGIAGPTHSFAFMSDVSKINSILLMVLGRLEFFALLVLFVPAFWKEAH